MGKSKIDDVRWSLLNTSTGETFGDFHTAEALAAAIRRRPLNDHRKLSVLRTIGAERSIRTAYDWMRSSENPEKA